MIGFVAVAVACDDAVFAVLPAPARGEVSTGETKVEGAPWLGARFSKDSAHPFASWKRVLAEADKQDDWVPDEFGYELAEWVDAGHMYLRFDIGFLLNAIHVRRQLVARVRTAENGPTYTTCWRMVDPALWKERVSRWSTDVPWQDDSAGWWQATPLPAGGTRVGYQYWTKQGSIPNAILKIGLSGTLPDLLEAFDAEAGRK